MFLQAGDSGIDKRCRTPVLPASANIHGKVLQQQGALYGVESLRVELYAPQRLIRSLPGGKLHLVRRSDAAKPFGQRRNGIAVAHPHLGMFLKALEQGILLFKGSQAGTAILTAAGRLYPAAIKPGHILCSVTDTQDRVSATNGTQIHLERLRVVDTVGRAGEDDTDNTRIIVREPVVRQDFAESIQLTQTPTDELGGLRAEIKNNNLLLHLLFI